MNATTLLEIGKDAQDLIQAWADPEKTKGWIAEATDLGTSLWNVQAQFPEIADHWKEFMAWIALGAQMETMKEYFTGDWVVWDLPFFTSD